MENAFVKALKNRAGGKPDMLNALYLKSAKFNELNYILRLKLPQLEAYIEKFIKVGVGGIYKSFDKGLAENSEEYDRKTIFDSYENKLRIETWELEDLGSDIKNILNEIKHTAFESLEKANLDKFKHDQFDENFLFEDKEVSEMMYSIKNQIESDIQKISSTYSETTKSLNFILKEDDQETVEMFERWKNFIYSLSCNIKDHKWVIPHTSDYQTFKFGDQRHEFASKQINNSKEISLEFFKPQSIKQEKSQTFIQKEREFEDHSDSSENFVEGENDEDWGESNINDFKEEQSSVLYRQKKIINFSNFNVSRSKDQLVNVQEENEFFTGSMEFLKDVPDKEPSPEVLTPEIESEYDQNSPQMLEMSKPRESSKIEEAVNRSIFESGKLMTYYLSQEYETQKDAMSKDVDLLITEIDDFIQENLPKKHTDLSIIQKWVKKWISSMKESTDKCFNQTAERIIQSLSAFQKLHNVIVQEKQLLETKNSELRIKWELLESEKRISSTDLFDAKTLTFKKDQEISFLGKRIKNLEEELDKVSKKLKENRRQYHKLSEEVIKRTAFMEAVTEQIEVNETIENKNKFFGVRENTNKAEVSYKWGLKDLNYKLNVKEEKIISLGVENNSLKEKIADQDQTIIKLESDILIKQGQNKVLEIDRNEAVNSANSNESLMKRTQQHLDELKDEMKIILEEKNSKDEIIRELEIVLDKRNAEIHTLKTDLNKLEISKLVTFVLLIVEIDYKSLSRSLFSTEKERDHLALLLDTAEHYFQEENSRASISEDSEDLLSQSTSEKPSIKVGLEERPRVIEVIKDHFLGIMREYELEKSSRDEQITKLTQKVKSLYSKNIGYINDGRRTIEVILEISKVLGFINWFQVSKDLEKLKSSLNEDNSSYLARVKSMDEDMERIKKELAFLNIERYLLK
jgi:hypothetical protein